MCPELSASGIVTGWPAIETAPSGLRHAVRLRGLPPATTAVDGMHCTPAGMGRLEHTAYC
jgi:hypothetical protein